MIHAGDVEFAVFKPVGEAVITDMIFDAFAKYVENIAPVDCRVIGNCIFPVVTGLALQAQAFPGGGATTLDSNPSSKRCCQYMW